jgi:hypothetical protein
MFPPVFVVITVSMLIYIVVDSLQSRRHCLFAELAGRLRGHASAEYGM